MATVLTAVLALSSPQSVAAFQSQSDGATELATVGVATVLPQPRRGIWSYFCYEDTASIDGSSPAGYYSGQCWQQQSVTKAFPATRGTLMMVKWRHVEPADGTFDWSALDANISAAANLDLQLVLMVEVCKADPKDPAAPQWLYDAVPGVNFTQGPAPANATNAHRCPYYLAPTFQAKFTRLIGAVAAHVAALPAKERRAS